MTGYCDIPQMKRHTRNINQLRPATGSYVGCHMGRQLDTGFFLSYHGKSAVNNKGRERDNRLIADLVCSFAGWPKFRPKS